MGNHVTWEISVTGEQRVQRGLPPSGGAEAQAAEKVATECQPHGPRGPRALASREQAECAFLLEVQGPARGSGDAAEPAAQVRDGGAGGRIGQHA